MGRKRNQGKARKAIKESKARQEAGDMNNQSVNSGQQQPPAWPMPMRPVPAAVASRYPNELMIQCIHSADNPPSDDRHSRFVEKFRVALNEGFCRGHPITACLIYAKDATWHEFADVWHDSAKLDIAITFLLRVGTQHLLAGNYFHARCGATIARFFEQYKAVELKQSQALPNWIKVEEMHHADVHTVVKFFRQRIPCSCLTDMYHQVRRHITKVGLCYNMHCKLPTGQVERSKTMYCGRCQCATYCSLECQKADWLRHKSYCDRNAARMAEFEARQQNA